MILKKKPRQTFDVTNYEHRKVAAEALKTTSWAKAPYLFDLEPEYSDVMTMVRTKMLDFYFELDKGAF